MDKIQKAKACDSNIFKRCIDDYLEKTYQIKKLKKIVKTKRKNNSILNERLLIKDREIKILKAKSDETKLKQAKAEEELNIFQEKFALDIENKDKELRRLKDEYNIQLEQKNEENERLVEIVKKELNKSIKELKSDNSKLNKIIEETTKIHKIKCERFKLLENDLALKINNLNDENNLIKDKLVQCFICKKKIDGTSEGLNSEDMIALIPCGHTLCKPCLTLLMETKFPLNDSNLDVAVVREDLFNEAYESYEEYIRFSRVRRTYLGKIKAHCPMCRCQILLTKNLFISIQ